MRLATWDSAEDFRKTSEPHPMPRPRKAVPSYRLHKQSGQAVVTVSLGGVRKDILLGLHGSPESKEEYERVLARLRTPSGAHLLAAGNGAFPTRPSLTVAELVLAYLRWLSGVPKPASPKGRTGGMNPKYALRTVRDMFGSVPATEFGPKALKAVREAWVAQKLSRKVVNGRAGCVRRMFKWGVSEARLGRLRSRLLAWEKNVITGPKWLESR